MRRAAALLALAACGFAASSASAATVTITSGPDPTESITTQVGASGSLETSSQRLTVKVKPAGASDCAANPSADDGRQALDTSPGPGPYAKTVNWRFDQAGSYLVCAWISDGVTINAPVLAAARQTIAVRIPHLSLTLSVPATVLRGRTFQVGATAQTEVSRDVHVVMLADIGRGCPANSAAAYGTSGERSLVSTTVLGGPTTQTTNVQLTAVGRYLVCGYVDYGGQVMPEATSVASVEVVPPCIVPHLRRGTTLRRAKARIVAGHCTVGKITYAHSLTRAQGTVIALSPRSGSGHAPNTAVAIKVSSGPPRHRHRHG